jgi:hypothetical protein
LRFTVVVCINPDSEGSTKTFISLKIGLQSRVRSLTGRR